MRSRLILLIVFAAGVFGAVYVGQKLATEKAREREAALRDAEPAREVRDVRPDTETVPERRKAVSRNADLDEPGTSVPEPVPDDSATAAVIAEATVETATPLLTITPGATAIEGYVFAQGAPVAGAKVAWRPSQNSEYVPPSWSAVPLSPGTVQHGAHADLTTENPLEPRDSNPIRLGGGFARYDTAIARPFRTVPGMEYELSLDSRYVHSWAIEEAYGEGRSLEEQIGEYGIDLTGQTKNHESPGIEYHSVTDGPNDCWRRFRTTFTANKETTSVWLRAKQLDSHVGLVWFDRLVVRPAGSEKEEDQVSLLEIPSSDEHGFGDYLGSVVTGPKGYYRIEGILPGEYDLCAAGVGKGSAQRGHVRVKAGKTASASFNLLGGGVIRGKVVENISAEPVSGIVVTAKLSVKDRDRIEVEEIPEARAVKTGPTGGFYLSGLLPGIGYHLTVDAPGYIAPKVQTVVPDGPLTEIALTPEGGVWGEVVLEGTKEPVEGAVVRVLSVNLAIDLPHSSDKKAVRKYSSFSFHPPLEFQGGGGERLAATVTDEEGRFSIRGLNPGTYTLVAEKDGRRSSQVSENTGEVKIESKESQVFSTLEIPKGSRLRGRVVDFERKTPIKGLDLVLVMQKGDRNRSARFRTGEEHPEETEDPKEGVGPPAEVTESANIVDLVDIRSGDVPPEETGEPGEGVGLPETLNNTFNVEDFIIDFIDLEETLYEPRVWVTTDSEGKFEVDDVGAGRWIAWARSEDHDIVGNQRFTVEGRTVTEVEFTARSFDTIEGTVLSAELEPVAGASIWPRRFYGEDYAGMTYFEDYGFAHSDAEGRFVIRGIYPKSKYDLVAVTRDGRIAMEERVPTGRKNLDIILGESGSIEGVIRFESGKPLAGVKVSALGGEMFGGHWWRDAYTDSEGRFRVTQLVTGSYDLDFGTRWPELHARYGPVKVETGKQVEGLELVIPGSGRVEGNVRFLDLSAAPGILVTATKLDAEGQPKRPKHWVSIRPNPLDDPREPELRFDILVHQACTDEAGDYIIGDLLPGTYQVEASYPEMLSPMDRSGEIGYPARTVDVGGDMPVTGVDFKPVEIEYDPMGGGTGFIRVGP